MFLFREKVETIEELLDDVKHSCLYDEGLTKRIVRALNQDALSHSDAIEENSSNLENLKMLRDAWNFAIRNFDGNLTHPFIWQVASRIEPMNFRYRTSPVRIRDHTGNIVSGFNPLKVEREMSRLIAHVNDPEEQPSVLLRAAELSLYGLFIHPFGDGNGRTFRLLHNLLLHYNGIPPVVIKKSERRPYITLMGTANNGFRQRCGQEEMFENPSTGEIQYFGFMLDKVQESAELLVDKYAHFCQYSVDCYFRGNPKEVRKVRDFLRRQVSAGRWEFRSSTVRGEKSIDIITDAPRQVLDASLCHYARKNPWLKGYDIVPVKPKKK